MRRALFVLIAGLVAGLIWGSAAADQNDPRLDVLFGRLQAAASPLEASMVEARIWSTWLESESPTVALLMRRALETLSLNRYQDSLDVLSKIVEIAPDYAEGWNKRATVHYLLGNYPESLHDIERTLKLEPRHFGALSGRGLVLLELDEQAGALEAFESALEVHPKLSGAKHNAEALRREIQRHEI